MQGSGHRLESTQVQGTDLCCPSNPPPRPIRFPRLSSFRLGLLGQPAVKKAERRLG